jgi:serine/threonine protein kinase
MKNNKSAQFGKYFIMDKIATGGMAELFRAKITGDLGFEKLVAIKKILPHLSEEQALVNSFIDEAKLAAFLHHENIVQIYDFGSMEGSYFIAMEYLIGKDLRAVINKSTSMELPLSLENAVYITSKICAGLGYSHSLKDFQGQPLNIIHRDISPQNVFITYDGQIKIIDFGIAKAASHNEATQQGLVKGKLAYMSPEQADGRSIDHRSDLFSTGILLYEMVTGQKMYEGETLKIYSRVRSAEFDPPEQLVQDLPLSLCGIIQRALAKDPEKRYQNGGEMLADLEECMYSLSNRPTTQGLRDFMRVLFRDETAIEEVAIRELVQAAQIMEQSDDISDEFTEDDTDEGVTETDYQETNRVRKEKPATRKKMIMSRFVKPLAIILTVVCLIVAFIFKRDPMADVVDAANQALESSRFADAIALFDQALDHSPQLIETVADPFADALRQQANVIAEEDPEGAEALLIRSVRMGSRHGKGYLQLGNLYDRQGRLDVAQSAFAKIGVKEPEYPEALFKIAQIQEKENNLAVAENTYEEVVNLVPPFLDQALVKLGTVQQKQGKLDKSIMSYKQAVMVNPDNQNARKLLNEARDKLKATK